MKLIIMSFNELGIYLFFKDCTKAKEGFHKFIDDKAMKEIKMKFNQNYRK